MAATLACGGAVADADDANLANVRQDAVQEAHPEQDAGAPEPDANSLIPGADCDDLLVRLQDELVAEVRMRAAEARRSAAESLGVPFEDEGSLAPSYQGGPQPPVAGAQPNGSPPAPADIAAVEGERLYLVHGDTLSGTLYVLKTSPADATEVVSTLPFEGGVAGLLVRDGIVTVFSRVYGPLPGYYPALPYYYYNPTYTKITWVDTRGASPQVLRESYVEGDYVSARRDGQLVRGILRGDRKARIDSPSLTYADIFGRPYSFAELEQQVDVWVSRSVEAIAASNIRDYLVSELDLVDGALVEQSLDCQSYWLPQPGATNPGYTRLFAADLEDVTAPIGTTTVMGYTQFSFANESSVLLAQHDYRYLFGKLPAPQTNLHRFTLDGLDTRYTASATLGGWVPSDTAFDERDGVVRVLTTDSRVMPWPEDAGGGLYLEHLSRVLTLEQRCASLVELGRTPDFSSQVDNAPTRLVGDHAYVTTSSGAQPLFVVDLAVPTQPTVVGELSDSPNAELLYPLWDGYLLALGYRVPVSNPRAQPQWSLALLDVRDPAAPRLAGDYLLPDATYLDSRIDYTSLRFDPEHGILTFSIESSNGGASTLQALNVSRDTGFSHLASLVPQLPEMTLIDCLELLYYPTDPEFVASVQADPAYEASLLADCAYYDRAPEIRRAVVQENALQLITTRSVSSHPLDALTGPPLSVVLLPRVY
jgi:hypothetical protein